jgi:hypothetical protein
MNNLSIKRLPVLIWLDSVHAGWFLKSDEDSIVEPDLHRALSFDEASELYTHCGSGSNSHVKSG